MKGLSPRPTNSRKSNRKDGQWYVRTSGLLALLSLFALPATLGCGDSPESEQRQWQCLLEGEVDSAAELGCEEDFELLASEPFDASIPGARSVKTVLDRVDSNRLYFQNSKKFPLHWSFAREHLSGQGRPFVPDLAQFNASEYYSPDRRFVLGTVTYYEGPGVWAFEISPYDTANAELVALAFTSIRQALFAGSVLRFHPTSEAVARATADLPPDIPQITTDELFAGTDYQPLNLATAVGQLRFVSADALATSYTGFRDIVVLDRVPNDIAVVAGIITAELQTPLSHINVLSQNRNTPNMALRGAMSNASLLALEGKWVHFEVGPFDYSITETTSAEADQWWEEHRPVTVQVPRLNLDVKELQDIETIVDIAAEDLRQTLKDAIPAFGGKASHYSVLAQIEGVPSPKAFGIPVFYYHQFMTENGFYDRVEALLADEELRNDPAVRDARLEELRDDMKVAPVDSDFEQTLLDKLASDYPNTRMRFRSSTNAEDLDGFTGAGLYTSKSGDPNDPTRPVLDAIRKVWASVWNFRAFEERTYRSISHGDVGMAILVHHSFPDEEANGVALTANPFDTSGLEPGFYVNVQKGEASVVQPPPGVTSDEFIYQFDFPNQPTIFLSHSNLTLAGQPVLSVAQTYALGVALKKLHQAFAGAYGRTAEDPRAWYAMDVEFKFDDLGTGDEPQLWVKQARPHPGR